MRAVYLESVLTRITCAANDDVAYDLCRIELQLAARDSEHFLYDLFGFRTLHGKLPVEVALMVELDVETSCVLLHPCHILVDICGVDDEEEVVLAHLIDEQVVDCAAVRVEHHAVVDLSDWCSSHIIREDVLNILLCIGTCDAHFAHMTHVEDAASRAYGIVLVCDVRVLNRHDESAEG